MENAGIVLLISCYELGHQPAGLTGPMAFVRRAGFEVEAVDLSVQGLDAAQVARASFVGISVPMHTALRLGVEVAQRVRELNPTCHICFYGLYAILNQDHLLATVADSVLGGESEQGLVEIVDRAGQGKSETLSEDSSRQPALAGKRGSRAISRPLDFPRPDRGGLPGLEAYARLVNEGQEHLAGYAEATRGCLHLCTHCPIPPVYGGRFFAVPAKVVIEDIRGQVSSGARHITFGDPDFLNGPGHSLRIVRALHDEFPFLTFDFTAKVEHLIKYRGAVSELGALGCIFVVSAIESLSDTVLAHLEKGHRREDIYAALSICRIAGIALRPSFVSFTPWTRIGDYLDMLEFVDSQQLIDHVDPIQFAIRLLVPPGSLLLLRPDTGGWIGPLIEESFTYSWAHPDPAMDRLHGDVTGVVEHAAASQEDPADTFNRIAELAYHAGEKPQAKQSRVALEPSRTRPPHLTEAWFCCAEPTRGQFVSLQRKPGA